jgi:hypothetical protein
MILRYHRPDFDDLPPQERTNLVVDACAHTNELLEALCKLVSFLEHGRAKVYGQGCARGRPCLLGATSAEVRMDMRHDEYRRDASNPGFHALLVTRPRAANTMVPKSVPCREEPHENAHLPWRATSRRLGRVIGSQSIRS